MTARPPLFTALRRVLDRTRAGTSEDASTSCEQLFGLMRSSRLADQMARRGHWQDALILLEAAAQRLPSTAQAALTMSEAHTPDSPELRFRRARELFAQRARAALAVTLEKPLATWRLIGRRAALALALLAAILVAPTAVRALRDRDLTVGAAWRASSTWLNPQTGTIPAHRIYESLPNLFFHTNEQAEPYVDIDLGGIHGVDRVVVVNRYDCCYERARGLKMLLSLDGESFSAVAQRDPRSIFRRWDISLSNARARYVRLQIPGDRRILHLSDVRVYGR